ncbi:Glucan endo-1,3-beta-glucosidase A1 [Tetrabaena socialis]|uniref:Glucan endo-1,3-beta-glucosidase A1 n=1 Tax=Tetrabaena socialis TaxID=47790 RepID=A0A2J7ZI92_9CHLO|nr:Glucan endo-1,3-beta-glucosidase A1 [Tetrabaena socialis]|eukprot:PNG99959.1 Glucan endo-1,3-beta-glucosidase A1 [Tetrabaena socialis]
MRLIGSSMATDRGLRRPTGRSLVAVCTRAVCLLIIAHVIPISGKQVLRWSDEFRTGCKAGDNLCVNGGINLRKWGFELGDGTSYGPDLVGWGNWQRQCHTNASENVRVEPFPSNPFDGMLVIQAGYHASGHACFNEKASTTTTNYTSARLTTRDKAAFRWRGNATKSTPLRIDIRAQVPLVMGTWPAAWMLPDPGNASCLGCGPYGNGWCLGGEIDIFEHTNADRFFISNAHFGGLANASWLECKDDVGKFRAQKADGWNVFSLLWDSKSISFSANGKVFSNISLGEWQTGGAPDNPYAPFDVDFYSIFDMAVGGLYPGFDIDNAAVGAGAARFAIDYIRVYDIV